MLGTICKVTLYDSVDAHVFDDAFEAIARIEQQMSTNLPDSEVTLVNSEAGRNAVQVSADTFTVIQEALEVSGLSSGFFDPSIGPLVSLWGIGTDTARVPEQEEIAELLPLVDYRKIVLDEDNSSIYLMQENMKLDLGGIAKGYAADAVREILLDAGVRSAIINLGGNILTMGSKPPNNKAWRIGIQSPSLERGVYVLILSLLDMSIVTSGPYERFFVEEGITYHHILDTKTGYPVPVTLGSFSIISPDSFLADALSTACYSLGLEKGLALVESLENIEAVVITKDNSIVISSGLETGKIEYELVDNSYKVFTLEEYRNR